MLLNIIVDKGRLQLEHSVSYLCLSFELTLPQLHREIQNATVQAKGDQIIICNICKDLLGRDKNLPLPPCESNEVIANRFITYFSDKISKICKYLESTLDTSSCDPFIYDADCTTELSEFDQLSSTQVKKILMASPSKSCGSDLIPTTLLKEILPSVIDFITVIVSPLLQEGDMPDNT